jgi:hypothetical protein
MEGRSRKSLGKARPTNEVGCRRHSPLHLVSGVAILSPAPSGIVPVKTRTAPAANGAERGQGGWHNRAAADNTVVRDDTARCATRVRRPSLRRLRTWWLRSRKCALRSSCSRSGCRTTRVRFKRSNCSCCRTC